MVMALFVFTASIEYKRSFQNHVKQTQDKMFMVKLNLESLITSRMTAINGLKAHTEINPFLLKAILIFLQRAYTMIQMTWFRVCLF